jgi:tetratricopeptide (TPR) repeat protein
MTEFPDPSFMARLVSATFGERAVDPQSVFVSAFTNLVLGRYEDTLEDTKAGIIYMPEAIDLYIMQGYAYCGMGQYAAAEGSYNQALELDPEYTLAYLLRAEVRHKQRDWVAASRDVRQVRDSRFGAAFEPLAEAMQRGELGCGNFFSPDNPILQISANPAATETAGD